MFIYDVFKNTSLVIVMNVMEDSVSVKSNESVATSEEFDFVSEKPGTSKTPTLDIANGDINELKQALTEVLQEPDCAMNKNNSVEEEALKIGQSMFYSHADAPIDTSDCVVGISPSEKQDIMKPDNSDEEVSDVDQDCTIFSGVTYLGAATMNAPKSESEVHRNMAILNEQTSEQGIKVSVSIPITSHGIVVLYDANTNYVIARYEINRILFYAHGAPDTTENNCFAFTWSHGEPPDSAIFQCHVFRCDIAEAVNKVSGCFVKAFQKNTSRSISLVTSVTDNMTVSTNTIPEAKSVVHVFEVSLEIKEDDGKGTFSTVPKDRSGFKFKMNIEKQLCLHIKQVSDNERVLPIERYFGVLVGVGRQVRHADMHLLEMMQKPPVNTNPLSAPYTQCTVTGNPTTVSANWDPTEPQFEALNTITTNNQDTGNNNSSVNNRVYMSVAVDLVVQGIQEPVRFHMEMPVRVYGIGERFWYFQKRSMFVQQFFLNLKEVIGPEGSDNYYEVVSMETPGEIDRNKLNLTLNLSNFIQSPTIPSLDAMTPKEEIDSDGDEPLLSGTGNVSKDCSEVVLENWADVLNRWKQTCLRPKQLSSLVKVGIPEALRGEVWQRLAGVDENSKMMETYRLLINRESSCETVIQRDIARTFPAHDFFKEIGGLGQDSLYRVTKAYAIYDSEVEYCQGLSFLAATLLLHMPEEQAFCVLVRLMYNYGLRDLYKDGFDNLILRIYQLNRLLEEQVNSLWHHFTEHHVETHMFASQWFLTLYTARFPLCFVFHIIDVFLLQGVDFMFQIALALLMTCKKDLLTLDFEGIMKYIRVTLPKKCRSEEAAKQIIKLACSIKVKKLNKYKEDFVTLEEAAEAADAALTTNNDKPQQPSSPLEAEAEQLRRTVDRMSEEKQLLLNEIMQLKEILKREVAHADRDRSRQEVIIGRLRKDEDKGRKKFERLEGDLKQLREDILLCERCNVLKLAQVSNDPNDLDATEEDGSSESNASGDNTPLSDELTSMARIRELELELAQVKVAHVEAQCRNQDLTHQLRSIEHELSTTKNNSWSPWLTRTLSSIKEVANKKEFSHFYSSQASGNSSQNAIPTFISHIGSSIRRDSAGTSENQFEYDVRKTNSARLKDSQSCSSLKSQN